MAKCEICGKGVTFGIKVSHSHRRTNRTWKPNVKRVKAVVNGTPCHIYACSRCLRSGKVERAKCLNIPKKSTSFASLFFILFKIQQKNRSRVSYSAPIFIMQRVCQMFSYSQAVQKQN